jgi:hypothetical protein
LALSCTQEALQSTIVRAGRVADELAWCEVSSWSRHHLPSHQFGFAVGNNLKKHVTPDLEAKGSILGAQMWSVECWAKGRNVAILFDYY